MNLIQDPRALSLFLVSACTNRGPRRCPVVMSPKVLADLLEVDSLSSVSVATLMFSFVLAACHVARIISLAQAAPQQACIVSSQFPTLVRSVASLRDA
jgi:hypothetical protein